MRMLLPFLVCGMSLAVRAAEWKVLPIFGGGYVQNVVLSESEPDVWYAYVDVGGLYRSDDRGKHWRPLHGGLRSEYRNLRADYVRGVSVDPRNADKLIFCGGDTPGSAPAGMFLSRDGGRSFELRQTASFSGNGGGRWLGMAIARDPFDPDALVAGEGSGVYRSQDNGETWKMTGLADLFVTDLKYDRVRKNRIYACCRGKGKAVAGGVFRSDDGGLTWKSVFGKSPTEIVQIQGNSRIVGYFRGEKMRCSDDGGENWRDFHDGLPAFSEFPKYRGPGDFTALAVGRDFYLAGSAAGEIYRRSADGPSWQHVPQVSRVPGRPEAEPRFQRAYVPPMWALGSLVVDPRDQDHWLATDWNEIWESTDAGRRWTTRIDGIMQLVSFGLYFDPHDLRNIVYGVADMGMFYSADGGRTFRAPSDDGTYICDAAFSPVRPGLILATGGKDENGTSLRRSYDAGKTWETPTNAGLPRTDLSNPGIRAYSLACNPTNGHFALCVSGPVDRGRGGVYFSSDAGESWTWSGDGLGDGKGLFRDSEWGSGLMPSITCGADGSYVVRGVRTRKMWKFVPGTGRWEQSKGAWGVPVADPFASGRFLVCDHGLKESTDGGLTFHEFIGRIPPDVENVAFDAVRRGIVVAATRARMVWLSRDAGKTFSPIPSSFSVPTGRQGKVQINDGRIYVFTAGSGVWTAQMDELKINENGIK